MTDAPVPVPPTTLTPEQITANVDQRRAANQANAVTGIIGMSGAGKSGLADTAAEYNYEEHRKITLCYAADLGGFGNKRLSLIHAGILRVYDPRNHINPFETMELISLGAFPEKLIDPERGFAAPDVRLILPRRVVHVVYCPQGHEVARVDSSLEVNMLNVTCTVCGMATTASNTSKTEQVIVRHPMFRDVGLRIYDSFTALGEWGLADLQDQSAKGLLPTTSGGGSLLGSADALRAGQFTFGSSSEGQYGFVQNRVYGWLSNIRTIPDQTVPAIATFLVELSKESKRGMGDLHYGPKIPGQAGTSALPPKLGNCLHASREPMTNDAGSPMVFRLWLCNHINPNDPAKIPYVAKHRGTPLGMPEYLEDKPGSEPWSGFSLKVLFRMLDNQLKQMDAQRRQEYPDASHTMWTGAEAQEPDEIMGAVQRPVVGGAGAVTLQAGAGRRLRVAMPVAVPAAAAPAPAAPTVPAATAAQTTAVSPSVPVVQGSVVAALPATAPQMPGTTPSAPPIAPSAAASPTPAAQATAPPPAPAAQGSRRLRIARPPVG